MIERRRLERFQLAIPVRLVATIYDRKTEVLELKTYNISAKGAFFRTIHSYSEGVTVNMDFILPVEKLFKLIGIYSFVKVKGKVVRTESDGIAVSFEDDYEILPYRNA